MDKYECEPLSFVLLHYLWGSVGAILFSIAGNFIVTNLIELLTKSQLNTSLISNLIVAPVTEEISKVAFLILSINSKKFDNITDGLIYGGAIGLGFGMSENFFYYITFGNTTELLIILITLRTLSSSVMHCISTATFGAFLGLAKLSKRLFKIILPSIGIIASIFIHFFWNLSITNSKTFTVGFLFMFSLIFIFIYFFRCSLHKEKTMIKKELMGEYHSGLIPLEHIDIIITNQRFKNGWINENFRKKYYKLAIALAFNKLRIKNSNYKEKAYYEKEIDKKRMEIKEILSLHNRV